jgi:ABC-type multidrug transport system ATPase subunit
MSEQILRALMQLFAIIARPEKNSVDRRAVVELFLRKQLNEELVFEYLSLFDQLFAENQSRYINSENQERKLASNSVRILKICTQINEELTQAQKIIVLVQLFEFVRPDNGIISQQESIFIDTVSDTFNLPEEESNNLKELLRTSPNQLPNNANTLIIDSNSDFFHLKTKHLFSDYLNGQIWILYLPSANMYLFRYNGESEMYLNGQLLVRYRTYVFYSGSSVRNRHIKPIYYSDVVSIFHEEKTQSRIIFEAKDIEYKFKFNKIGLHKMSFSEESGKLVGIMGVSGSGKTTLLNVLNGNFPPSSGDVLINGISIYKDKKKTQGLIGYVSQDDLLIEELTVFQNLYYNAKFCFGNLPEASILEKTNKVLKNLGLYEIRDIQVGSPLNKKISGGQRKRLNIALEIIREPSILFLDEPTSGLSSRDSENILDLLEELALKGKLVFVVIHQPSSDIFKMFDRLLLLDQGGYLIYNGDSIDSIVYFKSRMHHANWNESECHACGNVNPDQIFSIVEANVLNEYGRPIGIRKISPVEWRKFFIDFGQDHSSAYVYSDELPPSYFQIPSKLKQIFVFLQRDIKAKISNTQYLIINFLEAPVLAFILSFLIKYYNVAHGHNLGYTFYENSNLPIYLFMSVIIALFIGLSVSAEEIIKDRKILKREAFLNLSWFSYLSAKTTVLLLISALQSLCFVLVGNNILELHDMFFHFWLIIFSCWFGANIMGLVISDSFNSVITIYILIPFLVIPQIVLSGVLIKFEKLNPQISSPDAIPIYGEMMLARWGYEALAVQLFTHNKYEEPIYPFEKIMSIAEFRKNYWIPEMKTKIDFCIQNKDNKKNDRELQNSILLLQNEMNKESALNAYGKYPLIDSLKMHSPNYEAILYGLQKHLDKLNRFYIKLYNKASMQKDSIINVLQKNGRDEFILIKHNYHNETLTEFVSNSNEIDRIIEYNNEFIQKSDPIFLDPTHPFIKAQFYAPVKMLGDKKIDTFWANLVLIWIISLLMFTILYFRLLKRFVDLLELTSEQKR